VRVTGTDRVPLSLEAAHCTDLQPRCPARIQCATVRSPSDSSPFLPVAAALSAMLFIQSGASIAKNLFPVIGTQATAILRLALATLMMFAFWRPWRFQVARGLWPWIIAYGVALGTMNSLFYAALARIPLGIAVSLEFAGPLGLALLGSRQTRDVLWVLLAIAGIYLLLPVADHGSLDRTGVLLALGAGMSWAMYIVFGKRAGAGGSGPAVVYGSLVGTLAVLPSGAGAAFRGLQLPGVLVMALAVALLSSAIPYSLEMMALRRLPARVFGVLMSVEPGIGALMGFLLLGEHLSVVQMIAMALIITASAGTVISHAAIGRGKPEQILTS